MKFIAVQGCSLDVTISGGSGTATVTGTPSTKVKAVNFVFRGAIDFVIPPGAGISGTCVSVAPFSGAIPATAVKTLADGQPVCREDDQIAVVVPGQTPGGSSCTFPATVSVGDAGQDKVRGT